MRVFKFGGASIQDAEVVKKLVNIIKAEESLVLVISAMGKTTRALEAIFQQKVDNQPYEEAIQSLFVLHRNIIDQLFVSSRQEVQQVLAQYKAQLFKTLSPPYVPDSLDKFYSEVVAWGELVASKIIYHYLQEQQVACTWLDARKYIKTNNEFYNAQIDWVATEVLVKQEFSALLKQNQVVLTQGFIGSNKAGETTTLGKEGSDFTGAILAGVLSAQSLTVWKDVPGIMSADPKIFKVAIKFDQLSYQAMAEMAFYGAKVIHPKAIEPLATHNIPLYVRPFQYPHEPGTVITQHTSAVNHPVYILQEEQCLVRLSLENFTFFAEEQLKEVFNCLAKQAMRANLLERNACALSICLYEDPLKIKALLAMLSKSFKVHYQAPVCLLTVMHPNKDKVHLLLRNKTILLVQQQQGLYQAVFQK